MATHNTTDEVSDNNNQQDVGGEGLFHMQEVAQQLNEIADQDNTPTNNGQTGRPHTVSRYQLESSDLVLEDGRVTFYGRPYFTHERDLVPSETNPIKIVAEWTFCTEEDFFECLTRTDGQNVLSNNTGAHGLLFKIYQSPARIDIWYPGQSEFVRRDFEKSFKIGFLYRATIIDFGAKASVHIENCDSRYTPMRSRFDDHFDGEFDYNSGHFKVAIRNREFTRKRTTKTVLNKVCLSLGDEIVSNFEGELEAIPEGWIVNKPNID
jgi:hypothetical protein